MYSAQRAVHDIHAVHLLHNVYVVMETNAAIKHL